MCNLITYRAVMCFSVACTVPAFGQADFLENFEDIGATQSGQHGPPGLIADGWIFRNQSDPEGSGNWDRSAWAYQGNWSLNVDVTVSNWDGNNAEASSWAILPPITGQMGGDVVRLFYFSTQAPPLVPFGHLEIRYSPSSGTDTGSNSDGVGDFTVLLSDMPATTPAWTEHFVEVPGSGRIALRYHVPPTETQQNFWGFFEIDNLSVGPQGNAIPVPAPGETVHWTADLSPVTIDENLTIPAGGTLIVDPGVTVEIVNQAIFMAQGTVLAEGTTTQAVTFTGSSRVRVPGTLQMQHALIDVLIQPDNGGSLLFADTTFQANGLVTLAGAPSYIWNAAPFLQFENCQFSGSYLRVDTCNVALRNTDFSGEFCEIGASYLLADNVAINGAPFSGLHLYEYDQPLYLNNLSVVGCGTSGLDLAGGNYFIGNNVALQDNPHPVQLGGAGLLPGSILPVSGNGTNAVLVQDAFIGAIGGAVWSDTGIPYDIPDTYSGGRLQVLSGVTVRLGPDVTFWGEPGFIEVRGLPQNPVVFERLYPALSWQGLQYFHRFENSIIDGGQIGARFHSSSTRGFIDNSIIQNCDFGTQNDVIVRKTRFINNTTGSWDDNWPDALNGATGANSFEGNGIAVDGAGHLIDAQNNWWNDVSGPNATDNPGGSGDPVAGAGVTTMPFLTSPPDFNDHPPMVHMNEHSFLMEPGSKVIITWTSQDDVGVMAHRLDFDHPLEGISTVVELPGTQQAYEWTVPDIGFAVNNKAPILRVTAIDTAGQEGWDKQAFLIPTGDVQGTLTLTSDLSGPFTAGHEIGEICWEAEGTNPLGFSVSAALYYDGDQRGIGFGGVTSYLSCLSGSNEAPFVSTDTARIALVIQESLNNVKYFFSDPFTIRPDSRIGDEPPTVTLLSPGLSEDYAGGYEVPIHWTASDDEGIRSFQIQASYDGGRTWHVIAQDLAPETDTFNWQLPTSSGMGDVRIRVIASDLRYQTSSDGANVPFAIMPGSGGNEADLDGDGTVNAADLAILLGSWGTCTQCPADLDEDGTVDAADLALLLGNWT